MVVGNAPTGVSAGAELYEKRVNPQWVRLLDLLGMNQTYTRCVGEELRTADGRVILDFLSGYCVYNAGHNHPRILAEVREELERLGPSMLQSHVSELAGELAEALCKRAGGDLKKVYFCSSGSEGVETAIKFSRAFTGRDKLLYARDAFHGLTCGALSLMDNEFWSAGFGPMLPGAEGVEFGDVAGLESKLRSGKFAAYIVEPVQGEAGICLPPEDYLAEAQRLCRKHGTLLVLDEVQTGLYRTGKFLAGQHYGVTPDMVIVAKALSGGVVPSGAVLMTDAIYESVYNSLRRAIVHTSTYSENSLAMRAGLATLRVLEDEKLGERAEEMGAELRAELRDALAEFEMVREVRGLGMFSGIEFQSPKSLRLKLPFETFRKIHAGMFGQMLVMRLYREHGIMTQICGNNFMVLKVAPPLNSRRESLDKFVTSVREVVEYVHRSGSFWADALALAARASRI
jgi:ornithine--oxo-acid transaminase